MYMPEGPSARYKTEIGLVRYFSAGTNGWVQVEAPWHEAWAHQCQEAIDWVEGRVEKPISRGKRGRAVQEIMMGSARVGSKEATRLSPTQDTYQSAAADGRAWRPACGMARQLRTLRPHHSQGMSWSATP